MRMSIILPVAAALAAAVIGMSTPAAATTLEEALAICNKHGQCEIEGTSKDGVTIKHGKNYVWCPKGGGQCQCMLCGAPRQTQDANDGSVFGGGGVATQGSSKPYSGSGAGGVLTQTPAKPSGGIGLGGVLLHSSGNAQDKPSSQPRSKPKQTSAPKPAPTSQPKPVPTAEPKPAPAAPKAVRDNRGTDTNRSVSVTERESDRPKIKVRDHRRPNASSNGSNMPPKKTSGTGGTVCGIAGTPPCHVR